MSWGPEGYTSTHPWLANVQSMSPAYPVIRGFLRGLHDAQPIARGIVRQRYRERLQRLPGRCALLIFHETYVEDVHFHTPAQLATYLDSAMPQSKVASHRLWILEDLQLEWVEVLGSQLGVDPLVFGEQTNTFNFLDSQSMQTRSIPSMVKPSSSFTLRYFEYRQLQDHESIKSTTNQMTFAVNCRRIERWREIETKSFKNKWQHSFVRRCASFWSNQKTSPGGWDAVMLVDPAFDSFRWGDCISEKSPPACTILQDPKSHSKFDQLWAARSWNEPGSVVDAIDTSLPYHGGSHTLSNITMSYYEARKKPSILAENRNLGSLLDELVLHWTQVADVELIKSARLDSANSAHYLLKSLATLWTHQLDLIQATIAQSEYFSDDHQARVDASTSGREFRKQLNEVASTMADMHYLRRQMNHFESHMALNLERLGICGNGAGSEMFDKDQDLPPKAIRDAQKDFIHLQARLKPYVVRAANLSRVANELASLHASFKSVQDSELGLGLSIIASIVFPATLVASIFSMGGDYLPGQNRFWVFWATTLPITSILAAILLFSRPLNSLIDSQMTAIKAAAARRKMLNHRRKTA